MYAINRLPKQDVANSPTGCCPEFKPGDWDGQTFQFKDKLFLKASSRSFLHMPLNLGSVFTKAMAQISAANAQMGDEYVILSEEVSPWKANHFIAVSREVPGANTERLSGQFYAKVFEGPYRDAAKWYKQLIDEVESKGHKANRTFFFYTTCPKCAEVYGKNYVVGFAQI